MQEGPIRPILLITAWAVQRRFVFLALQPVAPSLRPIQSPSPSADLPILLHCPTLAIHRDMARWLDEAPSAPAVTTFQFRLQHVQAPAVEVRDSIAEGRSNICKESTTGLFVFLVNPGS